MLTNKVQKVPSQVSPTRNSLMNNTFAGSFIPSRRFHKLHTKNGVKPVKLGEHTQGSPQKAINQQVVSR